MNSLPLAARIAEHRRSGRGGLVSVCSAQTEVLQAAAQEALRWGAPLLVEATSNQVNQFGGYTGLTPQDFIQNTRKALQSWGFPLERCAFGGDHLGPNAWQHLPAAEAMDLAEELVRQYAAAGFEKIHLDCSMACADDPPRLDDETVARRAARLCAAAEAVAPGRIVYVIGTEVPIPGGAQEEIAELQPTPAAAAAETWAIHRRIFAESALRDVWPRVIALVVQPGVEFDHGQVIDYQSEQAQDLVSLAADLEQAVYEAHSTDYQTGAALAQLVRDHFAILKVGPALTFAYREALYALNAALKVLQPNTVINLPATMEALMLAQPGHWQKHYHGDAAQQALLRIYSLSDRIRYYWTQPEARAAVQALQEAFDGAAVPYGVLHQFLPQTAEICRDLDLALTAKNLILEHIALALSPYYAATEAHHE